MASLIYDYETLGQNPLTAAVVCLATLTFEEERFLSDPYTFEELISLTKLYKFDVEDQLNHGRKICPESIKWWRDLPKSTQALLHKKEDDISLLEIPNIFKECNIGMMDKVYTRGNSFDPVINRSVYQYLGVDEGYRWWRLRDTRSLIDGMTYGHNIKDTFIPEGLEDKFEVHNPVHDVAMDVMRIQHLVQIINGE